MASAEKYASWIIANPDKKGTEEFEIVAQAYQAARATGVSGSEEETFDNPSNISGADVTRGLLTGALAQWGDEARGAASALISSALGQGDFADFYEVTRDYERKEMERFRKEHPVAATVSEMAGALMTSIPAGAVAGTSAKAAALTKAAAGKGFAARAGTAAGLGAGFGATGGALYGAGGADEEGDIPQEMLEKAAFGAAAGAVLGPAFETGATAVKALHQRATGKMVERVSKIAQKHYATGNFNRRRSIELALQETGNQPRPFYAHLADKGSSSKAAMKAAQARMANPKVTDKAADFFREKIVSTAAKPFRKPMAWFDHTLGRSLATVLEKIHPMLGRALRTMEMSKHILIGSKSTQVRAWRQGFASLDSKDQAIITRFLNNGERHKALKYMASPHVQAKANAVTRKYSGSSNTFADEFEETVVPVLDEFGDMLQKSKPRGDKDTFELLEDFFPRVINDREGLLANTKLGRRLQAKGFQKEVGKKQAKLGRPLTVVEKDEIVQKMLTKPEVKLNAPKSRHEMRRLVQELDEEAIPYYMTAGDALEAYIHNTSEVISHRHLLGMTQRGSSYLDEADDMISGVNTMLNDMVTNKEISFAQMDEAMRLIQARLGNGTAQMNKWLGHSKNFFYATTIANPLSTLVQVGDTVLSAVINGVGPTIKAVTKTIRHRNKLPYLDASDVFDLVKQQEELISSRGFSNALTAMFKWSGFTTIDKVGKNVNIQSTLNKAAKLVAKHADDPVTALQREFGNSLFTPHEWADVAQKLAKGQVNDSNIKFMVWNRLSDAQPISLSEMPEVYLTHPNGRIWYAMKSYALKQLDLIRKRGFDLLAQPGRQVEGMSFLTKYAVLMGTANTGIDMVKQLVQGRELQPQDQELDAIAWAALKGVGLNEYFINKVAEDRNPAEKGLTMLVPGAFSHMARVVEDLGRGGIALVNGELDDDPKNYRVLRNMPIGGHFLYNYLGGNEVWEDWKFNERFED